MSAPSLWIFCSHLKATGFLQCLWSDLLLLVTFSPFLLFFSCCGLRPNYNFSRHNILFLLKVPLYSNQFTIDIDTSIPSVTAVTTRFHSTTAFKPRTEASRFSNSNSFCQPCFLCHRTDRLELTAKQCRQLRHLWQILKSDWKLAFFTASCETFLPPSPAAFLVTALRKFLSFIHLFFQPVLCRQAPSSSWTVHMVTSFHWMGSTRVKTRTRDHRPQVGSSRSRWMRRVIGCSCWLHSTSGTAETLRIWPSSSRCVSCSSPVVKCSS